MPIQTTIAWVDQRSGFAEINLVAPGGGSAHDHVAYTLTLTDVATGWTDCEACLRESQRAVFAALESMPSISATLTTGHQFGQSTDTICAVARLFQL